MATQQELQTVAKTFFDKIVLLRAYYFQFRLNHHTHYESYLKYSVFVVWFSFLIFVVRFQPADKLAAAEAEANGDAEEAEDKKQKRGAGAFAGAEQAAEKAFGCLHCHERLEDGIYERATKEIPKRNGEKLQRIARGVNAALHLHGNVGAEQHI